MPKLVKVDDGDKVSELEDLIHSVRTLLWMVEIGVSLNYRQHSCLFFHFLLRTEVLVQNLIFHLNVIDPVIKEESSKKSAPYRHEITNLVLLLLIKYSQPEIPITKRYFSQFLI